MWKFPFPQSFFLLFLASPAQAVVLIWKRPLRYLATSVFALPSPPLALLASWVCKSSVYACECCSWDGLFTSRKPNADAPIPCFCFGPFGADILNRVLFSMHHIQQLSNRAQFCACLGGEKVPDVRETLKQKGPRKTNLIPAYTILLLNLTFFQLLSILHTQHLCSRSFFRFV